MYNICEQKMNIILNYAQKKYAALDILNKKDKSTESEEQKS